MLDVYILNPLSVKHFHGVSAGNVYECSLKLSIGIVSMNLTSPCILIHKDHCFKWMDSQVVGSLAQADQLLRGSLAVPYERRIPLIAD
jgi:hypothetical protein